MADVQIRDTNVKITDVLGKLAEGLTYEQIIKQYPQVTLTDIMMSAKIAEEIIGTMVKIHGNTIPSVRMEFVFRNNRFKSIDVIQQEIPRAFAKWNTAEDNNLISMFKSGREIKEIADSLHRSIGSIRARLEKFGLLQPQLHR